MTPPTPHSATPHSTREGRPYPAASPKFSPSRTGMQRRLAKEAFTWHGRPEELAKEAFNGTDGRKDSPRVSKPAASPCVSRLAKRRQTGQAEAVSKPNSPPSDNANLTSSSRTSPSGRKRMLSIARKPNPGPFPGSPRGQVAPQARDDVGERLVAGRSALSTDRGSPPPRRRARPSLELAQRLASASCRRHLPKVSPGVFPVTAAASDSMSMTSSAKAETPRRCIRRTARGVRELPRSAGKEHAVARGGGDERARLVRQDADVMVARRNARPRADRLVKLPLAQPLKRRGAA